MDRRCTLSGARLLSVVIAAATCAAPPDGVQGAGARQTLSAVRSMLSGADTVDAPPLQFAHSLRTFYADSAARLVWVEGGGLGHDARELLDLTSGLAREGIDAGLDSVVYHAAGRLSTSWGAVDAARVELLLSDAFLRVADRLAHGSDAAPDEGLAWDIERDSLDPDELLVRVAEGSGPEAELDGLRSQLPWYQPMVAALEAYRGVVDAGGWPPVRVGETATPGDASGLVADVRARLAASPDASTRELARAGADPDVFDMRLAEAVALFQKRHGMAVDSTIGPGTVAALNVPAEERVADLTLNLDRLRRLPRSLGERAILVNVAGYELAVMQGDEPVIRMDVVVGQPEWRTHIFSDELEYLVVNPNWNVPASIAAQEILPRLREDPGYLEEQHFVLVRPEDPEGAPVPPDSVDDIDWDDVDDAAFPYLFRQIPGPWNALGKVKFMFPNEYGIYLHDTPAGELFERNQRAFSHGCVRVEHPRQLARWVLEHATSTAPAELDRLIDSEERTRIDLTDPIPVYIAYFTAWAEPDGSVSFHPDVYDLDEAEGGGDLTRG